jgi:DNA-binding transcriptional MerR regulator
VGPMTGTIVIPNKNLFKINEVCSITNVKPYVLRFWETEFLDINPEISESGQKLFSHSDIEAIVLIKKLLFEDKKTIEAAKSELIINYSSNLKVQQLPTLPLEDDIAEDLEIFGVKEISLEDIPLIGQQLEAYDIEKLVMAKSKLSKMLSSIEQLKERHQWS